MKTIDAGQWQSVKNLHGIPAQHAEVSEATLMDCHQKPSDARGMDFNPEKRRLGILLSDLDRGFAVSKSYLDHEAGKSPAKSGEDALIKGKIPSIKRIKFRKRSFLPCGSTSRPDDETSDFPAMIFHIGGSLYKIGGFRKNIIG